MKCCECKSLQILDPVHGFHDVCILRDSFFFSTVYLFFYQGTWYSHIFCTLKLKLFPVVLAQEDGKKESNQASKEVEGVQNIVVLSWKSLLVTRWLAFHRSSYS
jgi:hypothetical protein